MSVAINTQIERIQKEKYVFSFPDLAALAVAGVMLAAFLFLPYFNLESDGGLLPYTGAQLLTIMPRGVPRYEVISLFLVGFGAVIGVIASLVGLFNARSRWFTPALAGFGGALALFHYLTFFNQNVLNSNPDAAETLAKIGIGLWIALIAAVALIGLIFVPRRGSSVLAEAFSMSPNARYAYFFIAPAVIMMLLLVFYPLLNGILLSFTNADQFTSTRIIGARVTPATYTFHANPLQNYIDIFNTATYYFWGTFGQTVLWTSLNIVPHILIGLGLAMLLNRNIRGRTIYRVLLILPWAVPSYISAFVWRFLYNGDFGFLNSVARSIGVGNIPWLSDPVWAMFAVVLANTWLAIPFNMVTMLGGLQSIPTELYEAAEVDGANNWQKFMDITLPMLRPVIMTATLLGVIWTFNSFNVIFLVSEGGPFRSTEILSTWAWRLGFEQARYGIAAAFSVMILIILMIFSFSYIRILNRPGQQEAL
jgi:arabinogalactan oligomer / maltooligosaccharide transport system permease protein